MPTQFGPLEERSVDTAGDRHETGLLTMLPVNLGESVGETPVTRALRPPLEEKNVAVFVLDRKRKPLMPCTEKRARLLLTRGRAVVHRRYPFSIRLKDRVGGELQPVRLKLDPGADTTGVAVVREAGEEQHVLHLAEIQHRGKAVRKSMHRRAAFRRRRRSANLRYRAKRFSNRRRKEGWLAPSLRSRRDNMTSWVVRYRRLLPIVALSIEHVRFDTQALHNPEIKGVEYQQGELAGYEQREYLLEKWGRKCAYCGAEGVPLQIEHIRPKARGGSDRLSNLTLACRACNERKGARPVEEFLASKPGVLDRILAMAKKPLDAAAAVNAVRWALVRVMQALNLPLERASGGRTKWNRSRLEIPKSHALDATCVGAVQTVHDWQRPVLVIAAMGRGSYQRTRLTAYGFPRGYLTRQKWVRGFRTGDLVRSIVPAGKKVGVHVGRVAVRASGSFNIQTPAGTVQGIHARHCTLLDRAGGYAYWIERRSGVSSQE
jgi:5-methylcytosine-specific restriction endonuclease McrA